MRRSSVFAMTLVVLEFLTKGSAAAGQFKRIDASTLGPGQQRVVHASPQNQSSAMEIDVYEFLTRIGGGGYRCRITSNNTGTALNLRLIGLTGTILNTCTTPVNGGCSVPFIGLGSNFLFQCTVAAAGLDPALVGSHYVLTVQRASTGAFTEASGEEQPGVTDATGVARPSR